MNIQQLKCFVSLAETLNFSTTAGKLNLTQPAVSHNIKSLENELGIILFVRNKRTVNLTLASNSFYVDMEGLLFRLDQSIKKAKLLSEKYESTLVIGYTETVFEKKVLPDFVIGEDSEIAFVPLSYTEEVIYGLACLRSEERLEVKRWISTIKELFT